MKKNSLSKSQFMDGLRCPRLLWLEINRPELADPLDEQSKYLLEMGHRVEEYARQVFPGGLLIGNGHSGSFAQSLEETELAMKSEWPFLYEAAFASETMRCRIDILNRTCRNRWLLAEVKMSSQVKPEFLDDIAFQISCMREAGYAVDKSYLVHIYNQYVRNGEIEPAKMFTSVELTEKVAAKAIIVPARVNQLLGLLYKGIEPRANLGTRCKDPGKCRFYQYCHSGIPEGSVYELPYGGKLIPELLAKGITKLVDIPPTTPLSERQRALVQSAKTGKAVINVRAIKEFLGQFKYRRLCLLDFEGLGSHNPLPNFQNSAPYERIPFQFSLHVQETKNGELTHYEFLPETRDDPRPRLCEALLDFLGTSGSIIAWNASYEKSVLSTLSVRFPKYSERIKALQDRFVDLMIPFRSGAYTDYRCHGSASIKKVLPILVPNLSYGDLNIAQGDVASLKFQKYIDGQISDVEWKATMKDMLRYCSLDSQAMVEILNVLYKSV